MQVKPRFESYKFIERHPLEIKDDSGNEFNLVLIEALHRADEDEIPITPYQFWAVVGSNQRVWNNKAVSYSDLAFWRGERGSKNLFKGIIAGVEIEERLYGEHYFFAKDYTNIKEEDCGESTTFKIKLEK